MDPDKMKTDKMKRILILSDIHGNLAALESVLKAVSDKEIDGIVLLGDLIDYGPDSNEVIGEISGIPKERIIVNIWGNHEKAVMHGDFGRFSSKRGEMSARFTKSRLTEASMDYLKGMDEKGTAVFFVRGKKCLAVHGSLDDFFGKASKRERLPWRIGSLTMYFRGIPIYRMLINSFMKATIRLSDIKKERSLLIPVRWGSPETIIRMHILPYGIRITVQLN